ncbi:hypothetical protein [Streptomyces erythrochromogenes]|uniref:hypothetical protein n=1 Tax=Streptomyces erythrochromogenes TaxID=285574 RepID=UPI0002ECA3F1
MRRRQHSVLAGEEHEEPGPLADADAPYAAAFGYAEVLQKQAWDLTFLCDELEQEEGERA